MMLWLGLRELACLPDEPLEDGQARRQPFGMPLHAEDALIFGTLHALHHTVGGMGRDAEALPAVGHSLMVETVDVDLLFAVDVVEDAVGADGHRVGQLRLPRILTVHHGRLVALDATGG